MQNSGDGVLILEGRREECTEKKVLLFFLLHSFVCIFWLYLYLKFTQFNLTPITGIPELGIGDVEPVIIDEINLSLGTGPNGYRATFKDIEAYGVSNLTINSVR